jgi:hypothetical protein
MQCYGGLSSSSESEPYVYASIDDSWTPNSSKKIETGIGKQVAGEWFFSCPVLHWQSISNWAAQSIGKWSSCLPEALVPVELPAIEPRV